MIKITAGYILSYKTIFLLIAAFGLSACAPISLPRLPVQLPQILPKAPLQHNNVQAQRPQPVQVIPRAGDLPAATPPMVPSPAKVAAVRTPTYRQAKPLQQAPPRATPARRKAYPQTHHQSRKVIVPPAIKPVAQARIPLNNSSSRVNTSNRSKRPVASVNRAPKPIWNDVAIAPVISANNQNSQQNRSRKSTATRPVARPSASVRKQPKVAAVSNKKPVMQVAANNNTATTSKKIEAEVLDLSNSQQQLTASVQKKSEPVTPAKRYNPAPAVAILTKQANNQLTVGKMGRAAATLERALRIAPEDARLWLRLAEVNASQGNKAQAASMARKAIGMAPGDASVQARGQRLLN